MSSAPSPSLITIRNATREDVPLILGFVRALAEYERLSHHVVATEAVLEQSLFGAKPAAEALIASIADGGGAAQTAAGFALFFENFSTFAGRPGMYLEDLFVVPEARGRGVGKALFQRLAQIAVERNYCRLDWAVLDWNEPAIGFYRGLGASRWMSGR